MLELMFKEAGEVGGDSSSNGEIIGYVSRRLTPCQFQTGPVSQFTGARVCSPSPASSRPLSIRVLFYPLPSLLRPDINTNILYRYVRRVDTDMHMRSLLFPGRLLRLLSLLCNTYLRGIHPRLHVYKHWT